MDLIAQPQIHQWTRQEYQKMATMGLFAHRRDYWVINLVDHQLEVYREPMTDTEANYGFSYKSVEIYHPGQAVSPLLLPKDNSVKTMDVADLLP